MEQDKTLLLQLGERVKALRVTRGLSQEELAERAGMSLKHLGEIERAATEPSITAVLGLCKGLEVRVLELLPDPARITPEPKALSRDDWQRILEITRSLVRNRRGDGAVRGPLPAARQCVRQTGQIGDEGRC